MSRLRCICDDLDAVWREKRPELLRQIRRGASESRILRFERSIGRRLPPQLLALYQWHDGLKDCHYPVEGFFGWSSLDDASRAKEALDDLEMSGHFVSVGHAPGAWWNTSWIPFLQFNNGDHVCVDASGTLGAGRGVVFEWRAYEGARLVLAPSVAAWAQAHLAITRAGPTEGTQHEWIEHFNSRRAARTRKLVTPGFPAKLGGIRRSRRARLAS